MAATKSNWHTSSHIVFIAVDDSFRYTELEFAFQDHKKIYLAMDYYAGGDFLSLLETHDDILPEKMAAFYMMEIALAIQHLHLLGYVHR